jgi:predicted permease
MDRLLQDVRYGLRGLSRTPGFTAVALLTLALGTGVNATVFSFINALLLRPAAVPDASSLVSIYTSDYSSGPYGASSYPDYLALHAGAASSFEQIAAYDGGRSVLLQSGDAVERIRATSASGEFFDTLRLQPQIGRLLGPADAAPGAPPAAVITDALWERTFGRAPDAIQSSITLNGVPYSVVGVLAPSFDGLDLGARVDVWIPLSDRMKAAGRGSRDLSIVARIRDGVSMTSAQAQLTTIAERLARDHPDSNRGTLSEPERPRPITVLRHTRMGPAFRGEIATIGAIMMAAVILVLLIACANVASLLLSRATSRSREIAVRLALGAGRHRVISQMLAESVLLGAGGAALGLLFAMWTSDALPSFFPAEQQDMLGAGIDVRVLAYTLVVALAGSILFGLAPALQALRSTTAGAALRSGVGVTTGRGGVRLRSMLVAGQIALATVLAVSAALMVRSLLASLDSYLGFGTREAVVAYIEQPQSRGPARGLDYYRAVAERVRSVPGVSGVTLARYLPLAGTGRRTFELDGYSAQPGEDLELNFNYVDRHYFATMQIPVLAGRGFEAADENAGIVPAVVNDTFARKYYAGNAVGRRISDGQTTMTIVGVVNTGKHRGFHETPLPVVYTMLERSYVPRVALVARAAAAERLVATVRREAAAVDSAVAVYRVTTMNGHVDEALVTDRMTAVLVSVCGGLALLLAIVGVYGVVSFAVSRRAREIGVRVALGARPAQIVGLVLREGLRVTAAGVALGLVGAFAAATALSSFVFGLRPTDAGAFAAVPIVLGLITLAAGMLPARHALRVNPISVLRQE